MIDWNDRKKCKIFRQALEAAYSKPSALVRFVSEDFGENLDLIAKGDDLSDLIFKLIDWAKSQDRLEELFQIFCNENPKRRNAVIADLQSQPLIPRSTQLSKQDWTELFAEFASVDSVYLQIGVRHAFQATYHRRFQDIRPDHPPINTLNEIQDLLTISDDPILAVRFVEFAIEELARSIETHPRDLTGLKMWRDQISQQFNVSDPAPKLNQMPNAHAYLMVVLEEIGAQVIVYPELHITGKDRPIDFGATPTTCDFNDVAITLSEWIRMAEEAIAADELEDEQVTLELFLPCCYLEEEIEKTWRIRDKRGREIDFGQHRRFLVRSFDRIRDRQVQRSLKTIWLRLETCVNEQNACSQFHTQDACPEKLGTLRSILNDKQATGLKFVAAFPKDSKQRKDLLYDIIDAAIPIALWSSEQMDADSNTIEAEFDLLLSQSQVTNFASLARQWRMKRTNSRLSTSMRLLCDRPDRIPKLPDPSQEDDLLVAS